MVAQLMQLQAACATNHNHYNADHDAATITTANAVMTTMPTMTIVKMRHTMTPAKMIDGNGSCDYDPWLPRYNYNKDDNDDSSDGGGGPVDGFTCVDRLL